VTAYTAAITSLLKPPPQSPSGYDNHRAIRHLQAAALLLPDRSVPAGLHRPCAVEDVVEHDNTNLLEFTPSNMPDKAEFPRTESKRHRHWLYLASRRSRWDRNMVVDIHSLDEGESSGLKFIEEVIGNTRVRGGGRMCRVK
jgi:transposase